MFNNIGGKIKTLVKVFFWLAAIGGVIGGAAVCVMSKSPLGLLVAGVIIFVAWLGSFVLYGYGELIDCTQHNAYYLEEIYKNMSKSGNQNMVTGGQPQGQPQQITRSWECSKCRTVNSDTASFCVSCGEERRFDEDKWKCVKCGKLNKKEATACNCCGKRR